MTEILHLTERALWDAAVRTGSYEQSTRGRTLAEEGFIHCSTREQLPAVARFLYGEGPHEGELVVLVVDSERLTAPVRFESAQPGGPAFPHVYGPIPTNAVTALEPWPVLPSA
ncbi:DUF952 domain-containing protein [Streptomyces sp. TRM66268-LWL]|uniref:DUF952 domain-containing protein n=1 Tax=Streptomyces polyasparticus TaxID=2767826 RepID=A0ABR7SSZ2_9ACTN|nr:DUF952 domain-containing protein [Streptomyces polyasparticus]MBC9718612.1 DUF952 domain-containing protein [Streptomyces polyasparticus]